MPFSMEAACLCNTGKIRKNNEDNFYFGGRCLEIENNGLRHPVSLAINLNKEQLVAVFDGMGGENFGEYASFAAAEAMKQEKTQLLDFFVPEKKYLKRLTAKINDAVVLKQKEFMTDRMGTTMVALFFSGRQVYVCNVGDSRAYRLRNGEFLQLSVDHVEKRPETESKKAPLTQHLGIDPEEFLIEPHIAKGDLKPGDQYLLCSDGLTDMLSNLEIAGILSDTMDIEACVQQLVDKALEKGGRDNITVIVCRVS